MKSYLYTKLSFKNFINKEYIKEAAMKRLYGMLDFETLWQGKYASIISPSEAPYEAMHETDVIMCLPYLFYEKKYIIRDEFCPPYMVKDGIVRNWFTVVSGGKEEGESYRETFERELEEEAGIIPLEYEFKQIILDSPVCKSTTLRADLLLPIIYSFKQVEAVGDGTNNEEMSNSFFVTYEELEHIINNENVDMLLRFFFSII